VFGETLAAARATGFVLIWMGLLIYIANALWQARARAAVAT
jgi:EamA domain-containing membrane protein RarD